MRQITSNTEAFGPEGTAVSTSLDTHDLPAPKSERRPDASWMYPYRRAVAQELEAIDANGAVWNNRVRALRECGLAGIVLRCKPCGTRYVVPYRCGARTCPTCARRIAGAIAQRTADRAAVHDLIMENEPWDGPGPSQRRGWRHLTLTSRALVDREARFSPAVLRKRVLEVRQAAPVFWRATPWGRQKRDARKGSKRSRRDTSYVIGQEIAPGGMVHIHMLVYGEYVPQAALQVAWSQALGETARVWVEALDGGDDIAAAVREALKYATKGEKGSREQTRHAAVVEIGFRNVKRLSIGGVLRSVRLGDAEGVEEDGATDDGRPEDLHATHELECIDCGSTGDWHWEGKVDEKIVDENGNYGPLIRGRVNSRTRQPMPSNA